MEERMVPSKHPASLTLAFRSMRLHGFRFLIRFLPDRRNEGVNFYGKWWFPAVKFVNSIKYSSFFNFCFLFSSMFSSCFPILSLSVCVSFSFIFCLFSSLLSSPIPHIYSFPLPFSPHSSVPLYHILPPHSPGYGAFLWQIISKTCKVTHLHPFK